MELPPSRSHLNCRSQSIMTMPGMSSTIEEGWFGPAEACTRVHFSTRILCVQAKSGQPVVGQEYSRSLEGIVWRTGTNEALALDQPLLRAGSGRYNIPVIGPEQAFAAHELGCISGRIETACDGHSLKNSYRLALLVAWRPALISTRQDIAIRMIRKENFGSVTMVAESSMLDR